MARSRHKILNDTEVIFRLQPDSITSSVSHILSIKILFSHINLFMLQLTLVLTPN